MDPKPLSTAADRQQRHPVCLDARLVREDGRTGESMVCDISLDGCSVTGTYPIGEVVTLHMPRIGTLTGQVRWSIANRTGIRFDRKTR